MKKFILLLLLLPVIATSQTTTTYSYSHILTTNFSIPVVRFNFIDNDDDVNAKGNVSLFNSVGAGFGWNYGEKKEITENGSVISEDFKNIFGIHIGALFSRDDNENVFAPVLNVGILDFQLGVGYELGTIDANAKRTFITISYAIPLYKLTRTGYFTLKNTPHTINPSQARFMSN